MKLTVDGIAAVGFVALAMSCHAGGASLIAVDVGHSSLRPGAISARGIPEFEYNLALSRTIHDTLSSRHVSSVLIGDDGTMTNLQARTATASARGASFFLSVHHDSAQSKYLETWTWEGRERRHTERFSGFSLFVSRKNPDASSSLECARRIGFALKNAGFKPTAHHAEPIPGENREWADADSGVYFFDDLVVLRTARTPALLLEAGVILNRDEETAIQKPATRKAIATAVVQGLIDCRAIS
ncbi:N-acetylmuramoyl-L-alanine amidase [Accumulibacter sp.]|uniref:N-acetylmuramoyl-L-alanine amidase n=1 Tax=Accumulibacter sp. TaxID=2053492 RepID=UPI0028C38565|nr:N-acetylmuramoyl-L-alanine amidase [Accumulibacter sp.]